jgi:hypothetical protein
MGIERESRINDGDAKDDSIVIEAMRMVNGQHATGAHNPMPLPTSGPIADLVATFNRLPAVEKARFAQDHAELSPYIGTLFPNPDDMKRYTGGNQGTFLSATWDSERRRYILPNGSKLGSLTDAQLGIG